MIFTIYVTIYEIFTFYENFTIYVTIYEKVMKILRFMLRFTKILRKCYEIFTFYENFTKMLRNVTKCYEKVMKFLRFRLR